MVYRLPFNRKRQLAQISFRFENKEEKNSFGYEFKMQISLYWFSFYLSLCLYYYSFQEIMIIISSSQERPFASTQKLEMTLVEKKLKEIYYNKSNHRKKFLSFSRKIPRSLVDFE
jgi:hypothetical protein